MPSRQDAQAIVGEIPHLRRYARALLRDRAQADDLVQECLARAWGRLHLWRRGTNLRTWLFTVMHNLHANQARTASRRPAHVGIDEGVLAVPVRPTQEDALETFAIERALADLPVEQRSVLLLVGLEELSYDEAAQVLGIPVGTVMSRLHRARERLRLALASSGGPALRRVK